MINNWSIKSLEDLVLDSKSWEKKNIYATDSDKCLAGVYYSLTGESPTNPISPKSLRRMEVGNMVEENLVKKLKSQGIFIGGQDRISIPEFGVSGRPDGIIISPESCTDEAKKAIARKKEIYEKLKLIDIDVNAYLYRNNEKIDGQFVDIEDAMRIKREFISEDETINEYLLRPNKDNSIILLEIKSITEKGFEYRQKEGKPMESHVKQLMMYFSELRKTYPWLLARVLYSDTSYQNLLEFDVEFDQGAFDDLKKTWKTIKESVENNVPLPAAPDIVLNPKTGRWQVNYQADWCNYHIKCTGDPNWKTKAIRKVEELNSQIPRRNAR